MSRGEYPATRMRRNRMKAFSRRLVAENSISTDDLIWPLFVIEGTNCAEAIASMPGVNRWSIDRLIDQAGLALSLGIPAIAIFPSIDPAQKDAAGSLARDGNNLVCRAVAAVKSAHPDLGIICDVALDPFTDHGHDGVLNKDGLVDNDKTVDILCQGALIAAGSGFDIVAPSDMMDGRIGKIRKSLDKNGYHMTQILSYAVKYASSFYGPFREAVGSKGLLKGNKKNYQMDFRNSTEALREVGLGSGKANV